jgi:hypothetical protein
MPAAVYAGITFTFTRARAPLGHPLIEVHEILYPAMGVPLIDRLELPITTPTEHVLLQLTLIVDALGS